MTTQNAITWPERYLPGTGDNFVSNEVVVAGLSAADVWRHLVDTSRWESYYDNVADIGFPQGGGSVLTDGIHFSFGTFGFPPLDAHVVEFQAPAEDTRAVCPGRRSRTARPRSGSTSCTPGSWRTCPAAGSASSPRRPRSVGPPPRWPPSGRTRCSTATRPGSTA
ncbi:hypothetical protein [Streptomyces mirabilis]|uniref:hypothetical protein n=1 Tax=Streptomyces mirabilis TaxID=68239 RepID=UPI0036C56FC8